MPAPNYNLIRPEIRESLDRYAREGCPTGSFLEAVLENDLMEAFLRADDGNIATMFHIVCYVYNELPSNCHGSAQNVEGWLEVHRMRRREEQRLAEIRASKPAGEI